MVLLQFITLVVVEEVHTKKMVQLLLVDNLVLVVKEAEDLEDYNVQDQHHNMAQEQQVLQIEAAAEEAVVVVHLKHQQVMVVKE